MEFVRVGVKRIAVVCAGSAALGTTLGTVDLGSAGLGSEAQSARSRTCPSLAGANIVQTLDLPGRPGFLLLAKSDLWVAISATRPYGRGALVRIDPSSGRVRRVFRLPVNPSQVALGFGSLWLTGDTTDRRYRGLLRLDPNTGRVLRVIRGPKELGSKIATTTDSVWVGGADIFPQGHSERAGVRFVYKIDPQRNAVVRQVRLPGEATVIDLAGAGRALWVAGWWGVSKLSPSGRVLFQQPIDGSGWSLAVTPEAVWVAQPWFGTRPVREQNRPAQQLLRIAIAARPRVSTIDLQTQPGSVSTAGGVVWVSVKGGLARVNATEVPPVLRQTAVSVVASYQEAFVGGLWLSHRHANRVSKIC
jgi:hypothetical protein